MSKLAKVLQAAAGNTPAGDLAAAIDFDGTNDYLSRSSDMTGNADGKTFTISAWGYRTAFGTHFIYQASTDRFNLYGKSNGNFELAALNSSGSFVLEMIIGGVSDAPLMPLNTWTHILISVDLTNTSNRYVYVNDVAYAGSLTYNTYVNDNIDFTRTAHSVGSSTSGGQKWKGRLSNVFLDYTYRDLSVTNNRRLFITEDGKPADGQAGLSPIMYMPLDDPEDIGYNAGTGGDFTVNGVMARSGRGPNQDNCVASYFDGTNDYLNKTSISIPASKTYTLSFNVSRPVVGNNYCIWAGESASVSFYFNSYNGGFFFQNSSGANVLTVSVQDVLAPTVVNRTTHVDLSFDLTDSNKRHLFIDGVDKTSSVNWSTYTNDNVRTINNLTVNAWNADPNINPIFIGEYYLNNTYTNLATSNPFWDSTANRPNSVRKVIEDTGVTPLVALPIMGSDAGNNLGTVGDFTVNSGPYPGARGASEFLARSANLSSSSAYLSRSAALTGSSAGKTLTIVIAVKPTVLNDSHAFFAIDNGTAAALQIGMKQSSGYLDFAGGDSNTFKISTTTVIPLNQWSIIMAAVDLTNTAKRKIFINGTELSPSWNDYNNTNLDLNSSNVNIGKRPSTNNYRGNVGFLYYTQDYIDFSQESNRLKFVDGLGYPRDLTQQIEDGDIPTPLVYMKFDDTSALGTNSGTGGDFTINGTVTSGADVSV
tara:strand:- start:172 stop:2286 length:2115 start_codon:yes stop_codon:yes gene_type:complete